MPSSARNSPSRTAFATADDDTSDRVQDDSSNDQDGADTPQAAVPKAMSTGP
jgi:hypothetical protein